MTDKEKLEVRQIREQALQGMYENLVKLLVATGYNPEKFFELNLKNLKVHRKKLEQLLSTKKQPGDQLQ